MYKNIRRYPDDRPTQREAERLSSPVDMAHVDRILSWEYIQHPTALEKAMTDRPAESQWQGQTPEELVANDRCPKCLGELDTGWECNNCGYDAMPIAARLKKEQK